MKRRLSRFKTCKIRKTLEKIDSGVDATAAMESVIRTRRNVEMMQGDKKRMNIMEKWRVTGQKKMERPRMNGAKVHKL